MEVRLHPSFQGWLDEIGGIKDEAFDWFEVSGDVMALIAQSGFQTHRQTRRQTMTATNRPKVPVDDQGPNEVTDADWARDDSPHRHFERIANDEAAQAALNSALDQIRQHQATLAQVRKAKQLTQTTIGELLEMDQSEVSRLERRSDMLLSTLRSFIQAAGGELQLVATFPESPPVQLLVGDED